MKIKSFHQKFDATPKHEKFQVFNPPAKPTSLFIIFKQLATVRAQKKFFEDEEARLLSIAEDEFKKRDG